MTFSQFVNKTQEYLTSLRVIKDHISLDLRLPDTWVVLKSHVQKIEVVPVENSNKDGRKIYSFVCKNTDVDLNNMEEAFELVVKYNIERQEKEKLFKSKIQELKTIFEKENLDSLRHLKFDVELEQTLLIDGTEGDTKDDVLVQDGEN
jgi:hypothetical protein